MENIDTTKYKTRRERDHQAQAIIYRHIALEQVRKVAKATKLKLSKIKPALKAIFIGVLVYIALS